MLFRGNSNSELPPLALAMLASAQPGYDELFSVLGAGAVAFSEYVERA